MKKRVWNFLPKKKALGFFEDSVVKGDWSEFIPKGMLRFISAFKGDKAEDSIHIEVKGIRESRDYDKAEAQLSTAHKPVLRLHSQKWWNTKSPLKLQVRHYHKSSKQLEEEVLGNEIGIQEIQKPFRFTIGSSNFGKIRFGDDYVDKSELVATFDNSGHEVCVNTFPRRFQKTTNLSTIEHFYGIEVDEEGRALPVEERNHPALFAGGKAVSVDGTAKFLKPLKVSAYPDVMSKMGTVPVISADFQGVSGDSYETALVGIKDAVYNAVAKHKYLKFSSKVGDSFKFQRFIDFLKNGDIAETELRYIIRDLSEFLHAHFGVPAIILVDEYDTAINSAYRNLRMDPYDADKIIGLHRDVLGSALKGNNSLYKGLVTGILRIAKANIFSGLNNLGEFSMNDKKFAGHYGFTQRDVDELMLRFNVPTELAKDFRDWYNGYDILGELIYNPWSVIKALEAYDTYRNISDTSQIHEVVLRNYWQESGNIGFISPLFKHPSVEGAFRKLSEGNKIEFDLIEQISVSNFLALREMMGHSSSYEITPHGQDILFSYLFASGYLTSGGREGYYRAPNKEARDEFTKRLLTYYKNTYKLDVSFFRKLTDQIQLVFDAEKDGEYTEAINGIRGTLNALLKQLPGFVKLNKVKIDPVSEDVLHGNESLIQGIVSHASMQLLSATQFGTEVSVGEGRTDCLIINDKSKKAIILELKYNQGDASGAVEQIGKKGYAKPIPKGYEVVNIGLNVDYDKAVSVEYKVQPKDTAGMFDIIASGIASETEVTVSGDHQDTDIDGDTI